MPAALRLALLALLLSFAPPAPAGSGTVCPPDAEQPAPEVVQDALHDARDRGFLWRIGKNGRTSYLYGTIHVARFEWMFPGPRVMQALAATDTVALELDVMDADIQRRIAEGMASQHGAALPEPLQQRLRQQAGQLCVAYDALATLSPELQVTTLTVMAGRAAGLDPAYAIDGVLAGIGHGAHKHMVSLETPEAQLRVLQMKDAQATIAFVRESLDELEAGRTGTMLARIAGVWADADYAEMERFDEWCDCLDTGIEREMMGRLLDGRNPALAERIDALHASGKQVFAAVGSLHMFGPAGLPVLMEKRGYRVEQIELKPH